MTCPACGGSAVHRSRVRAFTERARTHLTSRRPHRCLVCGWRGWLSPADSAPHRPPGVVTCEPLDLRVLDATLDRTGRQAARYSPETAERQDPVVALDVPSSRLRS